MGRINAVADTASATIDKATNIALLLVTFPSRTTIVKHSKEIPAKIDEKGLYKLK